MFHYWQRCCQYWCLIIALLLRKAGSRLVQSLVLYNVFHPWIVDPPIVWGVVSLSLVPHRFSPVCRSRGGEGEARGRREARVLERSVI